MKNPNTARYADLPDSYGLYLPLAGVEYEYVEVSVSHQRRWSDPEWFGVVTEIHRLQPNGSPFLSDPRNYHRVAADRPTRKHRRTLARHWRDRLKQMDRLCTSGTIVDDEFESALIGVVWVFRTPVWPPWPADTPLLARPTPFDVRPEWLTDTVRGLEEAANEEDDFGPLRMSVLADALEEAGVPSTDFFDFLPRLRAADREAVRSMSAALWSDL